MGAKGQQVSQTNQSQTYAPAGGNYLTNALNQAGSAASLPFNIPQQPVAGFGGLQQQALAGYGGLGNISSPYTQQAASYFSPQGAQQFFNPYAQNVMANLQDVFGQQNTQNQGSLAQQAGGLGADRIAVGQSELAKQQGLVAGQTLSGLYGQAQQQAQQAGQNIGNLGFQAQGAQQSALGSQLQAGGLQQQLAQAQLNAPYQQQLAQAAFPYQQANFLAGITGSLAPGLGGTTTGQSNTTSQFNPSLWGQIGGGIGALAGIGGYLGGGGKGSGGNPSAAGTPGSPYYGPVYSGMADGGEVPDFVDRWNDLSPNAGDPIRRDPVADDAWRSGATADMAAGPAPGDAGMAAGAPAAAPASDAGEAAGAPSGAPAAASPMAAPSQAPGGLSLAGFLRSPYAALTLGGLEAMRTGSLASGAATGLKQFGAQETVDQAAKKLQQEAQAHQDEYSRMTPYQQATINLKKQELEQGGEGSLSDAAAKMAAQMYVQTGQMPALGYGKVGSQNRAKVLEAAQKMSEGTGQDIAGNKADYGARTKAIRDFSTGKQGDTIRSFDVATQHLNLLEGLVTAMHNGDTQAINRFGNAWATQTGNPAPTNFNAARNIVADEITKAVIGSRGALGDREAATSSISGAMSPKQLAGVIATYRGLMSGQLLGLKKQYEDTTRKTDFLDRLAPETKDALLHHAASAAPQVGARKQFKQGWGVWNGTTYVPEGAQ